MTNMKMIQKSLHKIYSFALHLKKSLKIQKTQVVGKLLKKYFIYPRKMNYEWGPCKVLLYLKYTWKCYNYRLSSKWIHDPLNFCLN